MALTPSSMLPLGTPLPSFRLPDPSGRVYASGDFAGAPLLVMILCNHCPYVKHIAGAVSDFARDYSAKGLAMLAINANDAAAYPDDAPPRMAEEAKRRGYVFPYLYDESQQIAQALRAACTPEFYLFDREGRLAYRGRFDGSTPGNDVPVSGDELRAACDAVLAGRPAPTDQKASVGCSIKWRAGNASG